MVDELRPAPLEGDDLMYWAARDSIAIGDALFLLNDWKPQPYAPREARSRRLEDTGERLQDWLVERGGKKYLWREEPYEEVRHDNRRPRVLGPLIERGTHTLPPEPMPRELLREAAEALGFRPKALFPEEPDPGDAAPELRECCWMLTAMAREHGYDPEAKKQANGTMAHFERLFERLGRRYKRDRIKAVFDFAFRKVGLNPPKR